jgi:hypothetical protein
MVRIEILSLEKVGLVAALEAGLAAATCEFVARLDADDICERGRLGRQLSFLRQNPGINVVGGQAILIDSASPGPTETSADDCPANNVVGTDDIDEKGRTYEIAGSILTHPALVQWHMLFRCCILHPSSMFRKSVIVGCGGYAANAPSTEALIAEDYALWLRVLDR